VGWWHPYGPNKMLAKDCPAKSIWNVSEFTKPLTDKEIAKWNLWPGLLSSYDKEKGETMYGFREGMDAIWRNQFRNDCTNAKFLISNGWSQGFGSEVHVVGNGLALALNMGRIYINNPEGPLAEESLLNNTWQVQTDFCRRQKKITHDCYYEPWSNCDIRKALKGRSMSDLKKVRSTISLYNSMNSNPG
jgi:hypothetical protein